MESRCVLLCDRTGSGHGPPVRENGEAIERLVQCRPPRKDANIDGTSLDVFKLHHGHLRLKVQAQAGYKLASSSKIWRMTGSQL
jgi:hypothetical protein